MNEMSNEPVPFELANPMPVTAFVPRILVIGDVMLDRYLQGSVQRISPEAPVPVVNLTSEWHACGGAANVAAGLAALGGHVTLAGVVGDDEEAELLRQAAETAGVAQTAFVTSREIRTITKTRIVSPSHQQLLRVDRDGKRDAIESAGRIQLARLNYLLSNCHAVIIADYDKGSVSDPFAQRIVQRCQANSIPCIVDPKRKNLEVFEGATMLAPNVFETSRALGRSLQSPKEIKAAAEELRKNLKLKYMLITQGAEGMTLASPEGVIHFPARVREVADVTGAGDTVVAVLADCLARGISIEKACRLAETAAGIAVSHRGAYIVKRAELDQAGFGASAKIADWETARSRIKAAQDAGRKVVFTNGCFDILHVGHLTCLEEASKLGDLLVVGLNSDDSVRRLKGPDRPVLPDRQRAALLAGLECVDFVVTFTEETPEQLVRHLQPDVLVKGGDYSPEDIAGAAFVKQRGGEVIIIPLVPQVSTTAILAKGGENVGS